MSLTGQTAMRILYQLTSPMHKTVGQRKRWRAGKACCRARGGGHGGDAEPTAKGPAAIESAHDAGLVVPELIRLAPLAKARL